MGDCLLLKEVSIVHNGLVAAMIQPTQSYILMLREDTACNSRQLLTVAFVLHRNEDPFSNQPNSPVDMLAQ